MERPPERGSHRRHRVDGDQLDRGYTLPYPHPATVDEDIENEKVLFEARRARHLKDYMEKTLY